MPCSAKRPRGDRFGVFLRDSQAHEDRPPVVDQGDDPPHDLAALPILCRETGPPPTDSSTRRNCSPHRRGPGSAARWSAPRPAARSPAPHIHTAFPDKSVPVSPRSTVWPPFVSTSSGPPFPLPLPVGSSMAAATPPPVAPCSSRSPAA